MKKKLILAVLFLGLCLLALAGLIIRPLASEPA
jgi:hypothetical protein